MYYKVIVNLNEDVKDIEKLRRLNLEASLNLRKESNDGVHFNIVQTSMKTCTMFGATQAHFDLNKTDLNPLIDTFLKSCEISYENFNIRYMTYSDLTNKIDIASKRRSSEDLMIVPLDDFYETVKQYDTNFIELKEYYVDIPKSFRDISFSESLKEELDRVHSDANDSFRGHPVHYKITSDHYDRALKVAKELSYQFYIQNRIINPYLMTVSFDPDRLFVRSYTFDFIEIAQGGVCLINLSDSVFEDVYQAQLEGIVRLLAENIEKYRHKILFMIYSQSAEDRAVLLLEQNLSQIAFVSIKESRLSRKKAQTLLTEKLEEVNLLSEEKNCVLPQGANFSIKEVEEIFNSWYDLYIRKHLFPSYKEIKPFQSKDIVKSDDSAYKQLQDMIGLNEIKEYVDEYINFRKSSYLFKQHHIDLPSLSAHMVFTGAPGTAKTTVARLIGRILKENGLLKVGEFHEVGRADIIERYVGWTAKNVKNIFKRAQGSVLFIDEAYSIFDNYNNTNFSEEAIATMVAEMENMREDVLVIFAGYPKEMQMFLDSNPGLASRIGFTIDFKNYSNDELYQIAQKIAHDYGFKLSKDASTKLKDHIFHISRQANFGNGRAMRNLIEKAIRHHGAVLFDQGEQSIDESTIRTLNADDFILTTINDQEHIWHRKLNTEMN